jgi:ubiquinone/menaquinone biosynthesis C-methylase UbiE
MLVTVLAGWLASRVYFGYVERLNLRGDEKVLEIGCGAGNLSRHLARRLAKGTGTLTCIDVSPAWLKVAKRRLRTYKNTQLIAGSLFEAKLPDATFDVAILHFVLHEIPRADRQATMQLVAKTLRPNGKLYVREPLRFITATEIDELAYHSGLEEFVTRTIRIPTQGEVIEAVYWRLV